MQRPLLLLGIAFIAACHIISGGDEIVVVGEDDEGGSSATEGSTSTGVTTCNSSWQCDDFDCFCTGEFEGFPCTDPAFEPDPDFNCIHECCP